MIGEQCKLVTMPSFDGDRKTSRNALPADSLVRSFGLPEGVALMNTSPEDGVVRA